MYKPKYSPLCMLLALVLIMGMLLSACTQQSTAELSATQTKDIILATTTSTQDSGLLDVLIPTFEKESGYIVKTIAVGTGQALKMGAEGNADLLFVHAPAAEKELMAAGFGLERRLVMHNDFIIVGPPGDPVGIRGLTIAGEAFQKIFNSQQLFISRGDDSGTHTMELSLWEINDLQPAETIWYLESGQGMAATLRIASEKKAYTLTDRATYLANRATLSLDILLEGDQMLLNVYHVIVVNPEKWPAVNAAGARALADFLTSSTGQKMIAEFGVDKFGEALFFPDANKTDADLGLK